MKPLRLLLVVGLIALSACDRRPRQASSNAAPAAVAWGMPDRPLRLVAYNVYWHQRGIDRVAETIRSLQPDLVLLAEVPPRDVPALANAISLPYFYATPNNPNDWSKPATAIISRFPLFNAHPVPNPGGRDFAVSADVIVDGRKFTAIAVHMTATLSISPLELHRSDQDRADETAALMREYEARGRPPMIIGGDFNQLASGSNYRAMTAQFEDVLKTLGHTDWTCEHSVLHTRIDYFLTTPLWSAVDGGVAKSAASDHRPIWLQTQPAAPPTAPANPR
jgi:endonuclease/exonuclease/phosphatase (EEP) superfamily protein YafD